MPFDNPYFPQTFDIGTPGGGHIHFGSDGSETLYAPDGVTKIFTADSINGFTMVGTLGGTNAINFTLGDPAEIAPAFIQANTSLALNQPNRQPILTMESGVTRPGTDRSIINLWSTSADGTIAAFTEFESDSFRFRTGPTNNTIFVIDDSSAGHNQLHYDGTTLTGPQAFFGHNQLFSDAQALAFTTGAFFQASADSVRPVVIRGHSLTQSGSMLEIQRSDTAVLAFWDANGLYNQRGVGGAAVGTRFVNNANNADLHFASTADGNDYVIIGSTQSRFVSVGTSNTPLLIWQFSSGQTGDLTAWQLAGGAGTIARITGTGNVQGTGAYTTLSDASAKENIRGLQLDPLDVISRLRPVHFDYLDGETDQVGWVAQELAQVLPNAVTPWGDSKLLGTRNDPIIAYLVGAVQTLIAERRAA